MEEKQQFLDYDGLQTYHDKLKKTVDDTLNSTSTNPVQNKVVASALEKFDGVKVDKTNAISITIPTSGWVSDSSVAAYPYKYEISVSSITAKDCVTIIIAPSSQQTAITCRLCPTNETLAGKIRIRASKIPTTSISAEYWIEKGKEA